MCFRLFLPALLALGGILTTSAQTIRYVKPNGFLEGSTWASAASLQFAINQSQPGDQIWVAVGTYHPDREANLPVLITPNDRDNAFVLKSGVKIYGGFQGTETSLSQRVFPSILDRNPAHASILSGDFNNNDNSTGSGNTLAQSGREENAYHIVLAIGTETAPLSSETLLDGFVITGGNANASGNLDVNGYTISKQWGGGVVNINSGVVYRNIAVVSNSANLGAAGMYNIDSEIRIDNGAFLINLNPFEYGGGGIYNQGSVLTATNVLLAGNAAASGGAIVNDNSQITLTNTTVANNKVYYFGGAIWSSEGSNTQVRNSILYGNISEYLPGTDATITNNESVAGFTNSIVEGSGSSSNWNTAYGNDEGANLDTNPLFTGSTTDYTLTALSPAINTGSNAFYTSGLTPDLSAITTDIIGNPRMVDVVDMGAFEYALPISATDGFKNKTVVVYPNPTPDNIFISAKETIQSITIYDFQGRILQSITPNNLTAFINLASQTNGVYLFQISTAAGTSAQKIIKQ